MTKKYLNAYWNETRLDCGIRHRTLDRGTTLCNGQNDKEEAQNIQDFKCHDRNECWRKASKYQRGAWTVARLIVISRSRPQLDLKECIGTYEFGVIPRSLFASYGTVCGNARLCVEGTCRQLIVFPCDGRSRSHFLL